MLNVGGRQKAITKVRSIVCCSNNKIKMILVIKLRLHEGRGSRVIISVRNSNEGDAINLTRKNPVAKHYVMG